MQKFKFAGALVCLGLALSLAAGRAQAGEAQQAPETKRIGVVFIQQVFENYNYAKDTQERMKTSYLPEQQRIEEEMRQIQELERALQNNPLKPPGSPPWRKEMMAIEGRKVEVQASQEEFARKVSEEEAAFWQSVYAAFQRACKIIAEYYQYDIIIATPNVNLSEDALKSSNPMAIQQEILMRRIQYVHDRANLTKSITDLLNHRYQQHLQDPQKNQL